MGLGEFFLLFLLSSLPIVFTLTFVRKMWLILSAKRYSSQLRVRLDVVSHADFLKLLRADDPPCTKLFKALADSDLVLGGLTGFVFQSIIFSLSSTPPLLLSSH